MHEESKENKSRAFPERATGIWRERWRTTQTRASFITISQISQISQLLFFLISISIFDKKEKDFDEFTKSDKIL